MKRLALAVLIVGVAGCDTGREAELESRRALNQYYQDAAWRCVDRSQMQTRMVLAALENCVELKSLVVTNTVVVTQECRHVTNDAGVEVE